MRKSFLPAFECSARIDPYSQVRPLYKFVKAQGMVIDRRGREPLLAQMPHIRRIMVLPELVDTLQPIFTPAELQPADDVLFSLPVISRYLALAFPRRNAPPLLVEIVRDIHKFTSFPC